jgi:hypothetical protein
MDCKSQQEKDIVVYYPLNGRRQAVAIRLSAVADYVSPMWHKMCVKNLLFSLKEKIYEYILKITQFNP